VKGKRLELSSSKSVEMTSIAGLRHALTDRHRPIHKQTYRDNKRRKIAY